MEQEKRSDFMSASRLVYKGPCKVHCVMLAADGANSDCQVYDGENTSGEQKTHLEALSGTSFHWEPPGGIKFNNGLYIAVNAANAKVTVTYEPISQSG